MSSQETYVDDAKGKTLDSESRSGKRARKGRGGDVEGDTPGADGPLRQSTLFRLRVRRVALESVVDEMFGSNDSKKDPKNLYPIEKDLFLVSAPEEPFPVLAPPSLADQGVHDRFYTLEPDHRDWEIREQIISQYASHVRTRIAEMDGAVQQPPVKKQESERLQLVKSGDGDDFFRNLEPLDFSMADRALDDPVVPPALDTVPSSSVPSMTSSSFSGGSFMGSVGAAGSSSSSLGGSVGLGNPKAPPPMIVPFSFNTPPPPALAPPSLVSSSSSANLFDASGEDGDESAGGAPKQRRKWLKMERIPGQIDLYKGLEKVLKELKDYKAHSFPFLTRVKPSDAPDYYKIIKTPMHFAEITRKLSLNMYFNKADFEDDLNLIWSNCRQYNTEPGSVFVAHASEMEKKQKRVMKKVPDIDLSPYRDAIIAENNANVMGSPPTPRMMLASSLDATSAPSLKIAPSFSSPSSLNASFTSSTTSLSIPTTLLATPVGPSYASLMPDPSKRRKALLEASDTEIFESIFDPALNPESAIAGALPPPEAVFLPPFSSHLQPAITPVVQGSISSTLYGAPTAGPIPIPAVTLPDDHKLYQDPEERGFVALTRALRLKKSTNWHQEEALPFAQHSQFIRTPEDMGLFYTLSHPSMVEHSLDLQSKLVSKPPSTNALPPVSMTAATPTPASVASVTSPLMPGHPAMPPAMQTSFGGAPSAVSFPPMALPVTPSTPAAPIVTAPAAPSPSEPGEPQYPRLMFPELMGADVLPEPPFAAGSIHVVGGKEMDAESPQLVPVPDPVLLGPDQRSKDLTIDAIRTITRAKVTRDSLTMVMTGYTKELAESKTPAQRGLLDEAQVQVTAARLLSREAERNRRESVLHTAAALENYSNIMDQLVVLFLSRMGVDQASRQAVSVISDIVSSRLAQFAQAMQHELQSNPARDPAEILYDNLNIMGVSDPNDLVQWYDVNVVQYADQMLTSEATLKNRIQQVEADRLKRQENLHAFLEKHATEGSELKKAQLAMVEAQKQMLAAQRAYYDAKSKNSVTMGAASAAYSKAQEAFRKHAKFIQMTQMEYEQQHNKAAADGSALPTSPGVASVVPASQLPPPPTTPAPVVVPSPAIVSPPMVMPAPPIATINPAPPPLMSPPPLVSMPPAPISTATQVPVVPVTPSPPPPQPPPMMAPPSFQMRSSSVGALQQQMQYESATEEEAKRRKF